ncbi:UDP-glycosyltransferase 73C3-like [Salvia miltiorrhiza]|uniref:UDP-glycosyltransferase 73C3-like n=1 Tax=Salvia miltiorrhiza TaxID=226208 RepID=UPI0025AB7F3A|nr:UDP-glycosyltransferase 73C3-like [Salvia miltiorrhiza]
MCITSYHTLSTALFCRILCIKHPWVSPQYLLWTSPKTQKHLCQPHYFQSYTNIILHHTTIPLQPVSSSSMAPKTDHLHFLLIPLMSQSHIIPLTDFGKLLAQRGVVVSIITTPRNFIRYRAAIGHAACTGLQIQMIPLEFPGEEAGLPQGCENMDSLTSMDLATEFFTACELLEAPLLKLMAELRPRPSCVISTNALPWTQRVADGFNIPRYIFETISCFTLLCSHVLSLDRTQEMIAAAASDPRPFLVPEIPHRIEFTKAQLPQAKTKSPDGGIETIIEQIKRARSSARGTVVNSFEEIESGYVEGYAKVARTLWCIGPVSACNKKPAEMLDRGNKASIDERHCMSWLDSKEAGTVIYACFGSLCRISAAQIKEIGLGLEASGSPFVWIIRDASLTAQVLEWLNDLEEGVGERGLIIRGWAPQVLILSHPSVGGFLTHCGWNSTLEGVSAGVPMITWPMFAEQFYNEKFVVQVLRIGVRVGVEVGSGKLEDDKRAFVKWERVKEAVEKLMGGDEEGRERRRRAREMAGRAREALEEGGSSYKNITLLIQDVERQVTELRDGIINYLMEETVPDC